jgi:hypothetical protein
MAPRVTPTRNAILENIELLFPNFSGELKRFNAAGERNFGIKLPHDIAEQMQKDGWTIKFLDAREDEDRPTPFIKVKINFKSRRPPRAVLVTSKNKTPLGEKEISLFDSIPIKKVDVNINPYVRTDDDGITTVTAYLQSIFVTMEEDELDLKYAEVPDAYAKADMEEPNFGAEPPF